MNALVAAAVFGTVFGLFAWKFPQIDRWVHRSQVKLMPWRFPGGDISRVEWERQMARELHPSSES